MIDLEKIQKDIRVILVNDIRNILLEARNEKDNIVEEKTDGDSATFADIQIGRLLDEKLPSLVDKSIVIEEESFDRKVFEQMKSFDYVWVVDPIDGTKAFRTKGNNEYCVAIALLHKGNPILSSIYAPEYAFSENVGCLFEARDDKDGAYLNGKNIKFSRVNNIKDLKCINHIHRDVKLNSLEEKISGVFEYKEKIRAYEGHSTLIHYCTIIIDDSSKVFTRREANIWDVIQAAYIVEKAGGIVMYPNGSKIIPVDYSKLIFKEDGNKLLFPFNIACPADIKASVLSSIEKIYE